MHHHRVAALAGRGFSYDLLGTVYDAYGPPLFTLFTAAVYGVFGHHQWLPVVADALIAATSVPMAVPVACVRFLVSAASDGLTGKTISASFDRWQDPRFSGLIPALNASDVFTQRRMNVANLEEGALKTALRALERP